MQDIEIRTRIGAPPAAVFEVVADHAGYAGWAGVQEAVLRNPGHPPPNGVGASRVLRSAGIAVEEEVTHFEPPERLAYRLVAGLPVRNYEGEVLLVSAGTGSGTGTDLTWRVRFRPLLPGTGWLLRRLIARSLRDLVSRLASHLEPDRPA